MCRRLRESVIRPLRLATECAGDAPGKPEPAGDAHRSAGDLHERLWGLARMATELRLRLPLVSELSEATAALQDMVLEAADGATAAHRHAELSRITAGLRTRIVVAEVGPYLLTNPSRLTDWLGEQVPVQPQMALCRCGESAIKPLCDGTHATNGFSGDKSPDRVADRRDIYVGQQVTILDNRGTCQHSGYCTDRLATVFHLAEEPFVTPSGGRMDEIIRAVRDCPSGALSYAINRREAREQVDRDHTREAAVEVTKNGPYRITGHDPTPDPDHEPTVFEWCGGLPALTRMTRLFYEKYVPEDPLLAPLFAGMSADHPQRVAKWLGEVFCGPKAYSEEYGGYSRMISQHVGKGLTEDKRARWVALLLRSAQEAGLPNDPEWRSAFGAYIEWGSRLAVENSQAGARPPEHMPMPHWDWRTASGPPGSRVSAVVASTADGDPAAVVPAEDEQVGFERHVKHLFRASDRRSMTFAFDLWSYDDVSRHADAILARLRAGTMPCDGAWPQGRVDVFSRWVEGGRERTPSCPRTGHPTVGRW